MKLSKQEKLQRLQDCVALLQDVDAMQQTALGDCDESFFYHSQITELIEEFKLDMAEFE
jgi:hypothetical protein